MRVWIFPEREWNELGAERFEVSWETIKPRALARVAAAEAAGEYDEIDVDADVIYHHRHYDSRAAALKAARAIVNFKRTAYGSATVIKQVVDWYVEEDRVAEWANAGEVEYVD